MGPLKYPLPWPSNGGWKGPTWPNPKQLGTQLERVKIRKVSHRAMDTGRLLLAFLTFGAACATLWAWMLANAGTQSSNAKQ